MTYEQIESFLTIVNYGNISAAADHLYVSQSTISSRIQALETELGVPLLLRQKGQRRVELTPYGESFISLAGQWAALWKDTQNMKSMAAVQTLRIAMIDVVNDYTFVPLFKSHMRKYSNIRLSLNTFHSHDLDPLIQAHTMDIGIGFRPSHYPDVVTRPIYKEAVYLVCSKDSPYYDGISPTELNPEKEIFLSWGPDFQQWHDSYWGSEVHPLLAVNNGALMRHYLDVEGSWALAPDSVVKKLCSLGNLTSHSLSDGPPPRVIYQLTNRHPGAARQQAIEIFNEELRAFIAENESITGYDE